jgi:hypothetical protein
VRWLRACAFWILRSDPGLKRWWTWLQGIGLDPESLRHTVLSQSSNVYTTGGVPEGIRTPWPPPAVACTTTEWRLTWYLIITPGSGQSGATGEAVGLPVMLCTLVPEANGGPSLATTPTGKAESPVKYRVGQAGREPPRQDAGDAVGGGGSVQLDVPA